MSYSKFFLLLFVVTLQNGQFSVAAVVGGEAGICLLCDSVNC